MERIVHQWDRKRDPFTRCGMDIGLWRYRGIEIAANIRYGNVLPPPWKRIKSGAKPRWCARCKPDVSSEVRG